MANQCCCAFLVLLMPQPRMMMSSTFLDHKQTCFFNVFKPHWWFLRSVRIHCDCCCCYANVSCFFFFAFAIVCVSPNKACVIRFNAIFFVHSVVCSQPAATAWHFILHSFCSHLSHLRGLRGVGWGLRLAETCWSSMCAR